jgi:hypothetical protein
MPATPGAQPLAVPSRFKPRNGDDRLLRIAKVAVIPERGWRAGGGAQKMGILRDCHLARSQEKAVNPNTMNRTLVVLSTFRPHEKPALRNANKDRFAETSLRRD